MTMSVGLGRIINDPKASIIVRKALGTLSTPGLLVTDTGVTIDDSGRIALKLDPDGGLTQGENGLAVGITDENGNVISGSTIGSPLVTGFVGAQVRLRLPNFINPTNAWSHYAADATLGLGSTATNQYGYFTADLTEGTTLNVGFCGEVSIGSGKWNVYMTGDAANHLQGSVSIGTKDITAKLSVIDGFEQLRLGFDASNYFRITVSSNGVTAIQPVGTAPTLNIASSVNIASNLKVTKTTEQMRVEYDSSNYVTMTVASNGDTTIEPKSPGPAPAHPSIKFVTGIWGGVQFNGGKSIYKVMYGTTPLNVIQDGTVQTFLFSVPGVYINVGDQVSVSPDGQPGNGVVSWGGFVYSDDWVGIRVVTTALGGAPDYRDWRITVIRFSY